MTRPLSTAILNETFVPGDTVRAVVVDDHLVLEREEATAHYSTPEGQPIREDVDGNEPARAE